MCSQGSDEGNQTRGQVEGPLQEKGERGIDLGVGIDQMRAFAATLGLMRVKGLSDFLKRRVSEADPRVPADTYGDNVANGSSDWRGSGTASNTTKCVGMIVDGSNELNDNRVGALVVIAAIELGNDSVALAAEVGEGLLNVRSGPLRDDFGDSDGECHGTGRKDSEDGRETHDEEA